MSQPRNGICHLFMLMIALAVSVLALPHIGRAQVLYGSVTGNVTDPSGASIPGATVKALDVNTGITKQTVTNVHGVYLISDLQAGVYSITISAPSFTPVVQSGIQIFENTLRRVDVQLKVAKVGQTVTVQASETALQTDRADVHTELTTSELSDLPTGIDRNFETLFVTVPGVSPPAQAHSDAANPQLGDAFYVNGADYAMNNTRLDGASDVFAWLPEVAGVYIPPVEDIEAVNIVTNSFNSEQGVAAGAEVDVVTKSGTNAFHGEAWEYNTDSAYDARNFFYYGPSLPKNILNQFGLNFGGPIKRNKLFFFAGWEQTAQSKLVSGFQTVANAALKAGDFSGTGTTIYDPQTGNLNGTGRIPFPGDQVPASMMSSAAMKMAALLPPPNQPGIANDYFATGDTRYRRNSIDIKIDYDPTSKTSAFARYSVSPTNLFDPQALGAAGGNTLDGGQPGNATGLVQSAVTGGTYTFTPHLLLDGNLGFTRYNISAKNTDINQNYGLDVLDIPGTNGPNPLQGGIPNFQISGFSPLGNSNSSNPFSTIANIYDQNVNLSWIKGTHSFRFGEEFFHMMLANFGANTSYGVRGGFTFSGGLTALNGGPAPNLYNAWADFLLGLPTKMGKDVVYIDPSILKENTYALYAADQWQVSRKLTATYGIRYELYPYSSGGDGIGGIRYDPTTNLVYLGGINGVPEDAGVNTGHGLLGPRLGIAYRLTPETVIRAGFGINPNSESFRENIQIYPNNVSNQFFGANTFSAAGSLLTGIPAFSGLSISQGQIPLPTNVFTGTFPTDYQRGYVEDYNLTVQRQLGKSWNLSAAFVGDHGIRQSAGININAAAPGTGVAGQPLYQKFGNSTGILDWLTFPSNKFNSLQLQMTHRVANGAVVGAAYTLSRALDFADNYEANGLMWNLEDIWGRNYAVAGFDRTQNFETYWTYPVPFGKGHGWLTSRIASRLAGGWQVNGILSWMSGTPFSVGSSGASLNAPGNSQTAEQVLPNIQILGGHGPGQPYFNPNAFAPVTTATFGNSGRNILFGPGLFGLNASLFRTFNLSERFKLQFRAEAYGLTNTPQFSNPSATVSNASFVNGIIKNLNGYDTISSAGGQRVLQFALQLNF